MKHERIRSLRKQQLMTQGELAEALHVSRSAVSMWEIGASDMVLSTLERLADVLGTSIAYLVGETDDPKPRRRR